MKFITPVAFLAAAAAISSNSLFSKAATTAVQAPPPVYVNGMNIHTVTLNADGGVGTMTQFFLEDYLYSDMEFATTPVGSISGFCSTTTAAAAAAAAAAYYCAITDTYAEGDIVMQGRGVLDGDTDPAVFVIVGGTGIYTNTTGTVVVATVGPATTEHVYDFF